MDCSLNRLQFVATLAIGIVYLSLPLTAAPVLTSRGKKCVQSANSSSTTLQQPTVKITGFVAGHPLISMACENTPIRTVLSRLFQAAGENYAVANDVDGNITFSVQSLPFDAILRVLFMGADYQLTWRIVANVYYIDRAQGSLAGSVFPPPDPKDSYPFKLLGNEDFSLYKIMVENTSASEMLRRFTQARGLMAGTLPFHPRIVACNEDNSLLVCGTPEDFQRVKEVVKNLDLPVLQAQIRLTFVDVQETDLNSLGISLQSIGGDPASKDNVELVKAMKQEKLPAGQTLLVTANNDESCHVIAASKSSSDPAIMDIVLTPTIVSSNDSDSPASTISTHLSVLHDFDFTAKVYSGETILLAARPEPDSKCQLIFLGATIMSDAADRETAAEGVTTPSAAAAPGTP